MTENLRKELAENEVLTPATSDVLTDVTVGAATQPYNQASTNYYDWGVAADTDFSEATVDRWLSRSTKVGSTWSTETTPVQGGLPDSRKQDLTGEDQKTGVYYNWYTATAGTGTWSITTAGTEASSSVCPAGWQLPRYSAVDGTSTLAPSGSWMHLIRDVYHIISLQGDQSTVAGGNLNANNQLHAFPFSLPYSGFVDWQGGTGSQGARGRFWSAGATSQNDARNLDFAGTGVWPETTGATRLYGFSVRCVANDSTPGTLTVTPDSIDADTATTVDVSIPLSGDYNANISLGSTALTCSRTSTSPLSFSCNVPSTASGTYTLTASLPSYGKTYSGSLTVEAPAYMQDQANINACKNAATGTTFTLTDSRDKNEYKVRKLADGKCWMVENLRLQNKTISNADSNLPSGKTVDIPASSTDKWCTTDSSACDNQLMTLDATDKNIPNQESADPTWGVYYNWYTATATYGTYSKSSGTVSYDICPKGWKLPSTNGSSTDFQTLYNNYSSASKMQATDGPAFVRSGHRTGSSTLNQGGTGRYWSSTASSSAYAYSLFLNSSSVSPAVDLGKYNGFSVRCVAQ